MTEPREPLSRWVTPDVPQHRLDRMWVDISAAEQHRRASRWLVVSAVASTVLALGVVGVLVTRATFDSKSEPPRVTQFTDGSTAELGPKSSLTLALQDERHVQVRLNAGTATFEVTKRPSRQFLVEAGDVRVRVVGTRFTVQNETETDEVSVAVLRGIVEVTRHEQTVRLVAGQVWHSTGVGNTPALAPAEPGDMPPGDMPPGDMRTGDMRTGDVRTGDVRTGDAQTGDEAQEAVPAPSVTVPSTTPSLPDEPLSTRPPAPTKKTGASTGHRATEASPTTDLFALALAARREGRAAEAVVGLERFIRDASDDPRVPLAAFELARLRMDSMHDPAGAVDALRVSLRGREGFAFREEALSRLVRALEALGRTGECGQARLTYLREFPEGAYGQTVRAACGATTP